MSEKTYTTQQKKDFAKDRWAMQNEAARLMKQRTPYEKDGEKRYGFTGLQCCGNVHGCPMCSSRISMQREEEVRKTIKWAKSQGYLVAMLTLTHPHSKFDMLRSQLDALLGYKDGKSKKRVNGAMYHFGNSKAFRGLNLVGYIRKFETTHGENGWHPHFHIVLILDPETCGVIDEYKLYKAWSKACVKAGLECPSIKRGLRIDYAKDDSDISQRPSQKVQRRQNAMATFKSIDERG